MQLSRRNRIILIGISLFGSSLLSAQSASDGSVPVIVRFKSNGRSEQSDRDTIESNGGKHSRSFSIVNAAAARVTPNALARLKQDPRIEAVEPDVEVRAHDAELDNTWGVKQINAGVVHDSGNKGAGVKVCLLDTGADTSHPDLYMNYKGGWDYVNNDADPSDDNGHGTHTAGTIAAMMNAANVRGAAPQVDLYVYKILNASGSGYASSIISALQECVRIGGQVTNSSFGSTQDLGSSVKSAYDSAKNAGIVNVASAGNSGAGANTVGFPGQYSSVIAVAATDSANAWASFSSTGPAVAIAAPGVSILSTYPGGQYAYMSGTSMASPHVAGVAALVIACGIAGPDAVKQRIMSTALDLGASGTDAYYGAGLVQADKAAMNCGSSSSTPPPPAPVTDLAVAAVSAPSSVNVNTSASVSVSVKNTGNQTASGFTLTLSDNGVTVSAQAIPSLAAGSSANLSFTWSSATAGTHSLVATIGQNDANSANNTSSASTLVTQVATTPITIGARGYMMNRNKGAVDITWAGASTSQVMISRTGSPSKNMTTNNDGSYTDSVNAGTYTYKVCEVGTGRCSSSLSVSVR